MTPKSIGFLLETLFGLLVMWSTCAWAGSVNLMETYNFPGAEQTRIVGINDVGDIAGNAYFDDGIHPSRTAFMRTHDGRARLFAASIADDARPTTRTRGLNVKGVIGLVISPDPDVNPTTGACDFSKWVDQCSGTNCACDQITVSSASGKMDNGRQTITNFFITRDKDIDVANTNPALVQGVEGRCEPVEGTLTDIVSATGELKTINLLGTSCLVIRGTSRTNPAGNIDGRTLNGAWAIDGVSASSPAASGWGLFSASFDDTGVFSIKLSGLVSE